MDRPFSPVEFGANSWNRITQWQIMQISFPRQDDLAAGCSPAPREESLRGRANSAQDTSPSLLLSQGACRDKCLRGVCREGKTIWAARGAFTGSRGLQTRCSVRSQLGTALNEPLLSSQGLGIRLPCLQPPHQHYTALQRWKTVLIMCTSAQCAPFDANVTATRCPLNPIVWGLLW